MDSIPGAYKTEENEQLFFKLFNHQVPVNIKGQQDGAIATEVLCQDMIQ